MKIVPKVNIQKNPMVKSAKFTAKVVSKVVAPKPVASAPAPVMVNSPEQKNWMTEDAFVTYSMDVLSIILRGHGISANDNIPQHSPYGRAYWATASLVDKTVEAKLLDWAYEAAFGKKHAGKTFQAATLLSMWKVFHAEYVVYARKFYAAGKDEALLAKVPLPVKHDAWSQKVHSFIYDGPGEICFHYTYMISVKVPKPVAAKPVATKVSQSKPTATPNKAPVKFVPRAMAKVNTASASSIKNNMTKPAPKVNTVKKPVVASKK